MSKGKAKGTLRKEDEDKLGVTGPKQKVGEGAGGAGKRGGGARREGADAGRQGARREHVEEEEGMDDVIENAAVNALQHPSYHPLLVDRRTVCLGIGDVCYIAVWQS